MTSFVVPVPGAGDVSAVHTGPVGGPLVVFAHGASGNQHSTLCVGFAEGLADDGVGCFRFNFPYAERGDARPDSLRTLIDSFHAAHAVAVEFGKPLWAGGKSLGARIASFAVAEGATVNGLVFLGFPIHERGQPQRVRVAYLYQIDLPMLFVHGSDDELARPDILERLLERLGPRAHEHVVDGANHSLVTTGTAASNYEIGRQLATVTARLVAGATRPG